MAMVSYPHSIYPEFRDNMHEVIGNIHELQDTVRELKKTVSATSTTSIPEDRPVSKEVDPFGYREKGRSYHQGKDIADVYEEMRRQSMNDQQRMMQILQQQMIDNMALQAKPPMMHISQQSHLATGMIMGSNKSYKEMIRVKEFPEPKKEQAVDAVVLPKDNLKDLGDKVEIKRHDPIIVK